MVSFFYFNFVLKSHFLFMIDNRFLFQYYFQWASLNCKNHSSVLVVITLSKELILTKLLPMWHLLQILILWFMIFFICSSFFCWPTACFWWYSLQPIKLNQHISIWILTLNGNSLLHALAFCGHWKIVFTVWKNWKTFTCYLTIDWIVVFSDKKTFFLRI